MSSFSRLACRALVAFLFVGCGSDPAPAPTPLCVPGVSAACVGVGGCAGGQLCNAAGSGYGACDCGTPIDAGPVDAGVADMSLDADVEDLGPADGGGVGPCDPVTQDGCAPSERCAWVNVNSATNLGVLRCVSSGGVAARGSCTWGADGEMTGYDNCERGLVCVNSVCARTCNTSDPVSCGLDHCSIYSGLFGSSSGVGACQDACDPVTQLRTDGTSCGTGKGCYVALGNGDAVCTPVPVAAETLVHGDPAYGPPGGAYLNGCAPGFIPGIRVADQVVCMALCRPVETSLSSPAGVAGEAPHACPDRGAVSPPNECVFASVFASSSGPYDPRLNLIGVCMNHVDWSFDLDGDPLTAPTPWPDCTTLSNTDTDGDGIADNLKWGCAPVSAP